MNSCNARTGALACALWLAAMGASPSLIAQDRNPDSSDWTPLMMAARGDDWKAALLLIDEGADVNASAPNSGMTAMMVAAWFEAEETLDVLAVNRADPNIASRTGMTALMIAAGRGNLPMVDTLLEHDATVDPVDRDGSNAMMLAVTGGNAEVVARLGEAGADVDYQDGLGVTPLMLAASKGNEEVARVLIAAGADLQLKDANGFTAADVARKSGNPGLVKLLSGPAPRPGRDEPAPVRAEERVETPPFRSEAESATVPDRKARDEADPPEGWVLFPFRPAGIRAAFPSKPDTKIETIETAVGPAEDVTLAVEADGLNYTASRTTYAESVAGVGDEEFFTQLMADAMFEGSHELPSPAARIRYGGLTGRSVRYLSSSDGQRYDTRIEAFRDGRVGYVMAVNAIEGELDDQLARDFFRHVELLNASTRSTGPPPGAGPEEWPVFVGRRGGIQVAFPGPFESESSRLPGSSLLKATRQAEGQPYLEAIVILHDTPEAARMSYREQADAMRNDQEHTTHIEEIAPFPGWVGVDAQVRYESEDEPTLFERQRLCFDGESRIVRLRVQKEGADPSDLAARYFGSLKLIPIEEPPTTPPDPTNPTVADHWEAYRSTEFGFGIDMPSAAIVNHARLEEVFASETVEADVGPTHFRLFWADHTGTASQEDARSTFEETVKNTRDAGGMMVDRELSIGTWTGRELVSADTFAEPPMIERQQVLWNGGKVFARLSVTSPAKSDSAELAARFFGSFRPQVETGESPARSDQLAKLRTFKDMMVSVVDAEGRGDFRSINEALGDGGSASVIFVMPGVYREGLHMTRPVMLLGAADSPDEVVIEAEGADALLLDSPSGLVGNLTLRCVAGATGKKFFGVDIVRGRATLEDCVITSDSLACVSLRGEAEPLLRNCRMIDGASSGVYAYGESRGTLDGCTIRGNAGNGVVVSERASLEIRDGEISTNAQVGVMANDEATVVANGVRVEKSGVDGVRLGDSSRATFRQCRFAESGEDGAYVAGAALVAFDGSSFVGNGQTGIRASSSLRPVLVNCKVESNQQAGTLVEPNASVLFERCTVTGNRYAGAELHGPCEATFLGTTLVENTQSGVFAHDGGLGSLQGCTVSSNGGAGVSVDSGRIDLVSCTIAKNGGHGIDVGEQGVVAEHLTELSGDRHADPGGRLLRLRAEPRTDDAVEEGTGAEPGAAQRTR